MPLPHCSLWCLNRRPQRRRCCRRLKFLPKVRRSIRRSTASEPSNVSRESLSVTMVDGLFIIACFCMVCAFDYVHADVLRSFSSFEWFQFLLMFVLLLYLCRVVYVLFLLCR